MAADMAKIYEVAVKIAKDAGGMIREAFRLDQVIQTKEGAMDLVTETDQNVEKYITDMVEESFPTHSFIGEESVAAGKKCELTDNPTWIVDPIDGTTNFVHRFPFVAVSIAVAVNKDIEIGVVYNPIQDQLYTARKGQGAFVNGKPLKVSGKENLGEALLLGEFGADRNPENFKTKMDNFHKIMLQARGMRSLGSAALNMCMIASGVNDGYIEYGIHIWDIAAGYLILREAGGVVLDPSGDAVDLCSRSVLCGSTDKLCREIASKVNHVRYERD
ncbi:inositol monophosphatase 1-like [Liolophura sinensis]|uniref:inositol monophosphatase 1-like n=1 Tax=Liolophura sinensis TaxID=3198878 RepID=UPI0031582108